MENATVSPGVFPAIFSSLEDWQTLKGFFSMTPCVFFLYVSLVMLFTLWSKKIFCETPRYILFSHLLVSDSLQLWCTFVYYILYTSPLDQATLSIMSYICFFNYLASRITNNFLTPIYLTLMSLERYVAICFPLRHAQIANKRRTMVAVMAVWSLGLVIWTTDLTVAMVFQAGSSKRSCSDYILSQMIVSYQVSTGSIALVFTLACVVIIYVYIAIVVTARSTTASDKSSASKAHKTVLLHMVQLCLCLSSLLMGAVRRTLVMSGLDRVRYDEVSYVLFLMLNILPRCLSPIIYGLRDKTFCAYFKVHFLFCIKSKVQPSKLDI
ncbi:hypothetical protein ACEWY4_010038 [Coilia grayii]|uniref:G-protein coupled receptors family 1 profile domain-containing protein n=1 Tax=Coilia grayii TaxID=363190 RepID=A0ABD1K8A0_9TELE